MRVPAVRIGALCISLALAVAACDGEGGEPESASEHEHAGVGSTMGGAGGAADAPDAAAPAEAIPELNGCTEGAYEDRSAEGDERVIAIAAAGLTFTPKCMVIAAGQRVRWEGSLAAHPLAAGNPDDREAGTAESPIESSATGRSVEFAFEKPGTFPYYCTLHAFGNGRGMAGVIHVR